MKDRDVLSNLLYSNIRFDSSFCYHVMFFLKIDAWQFWILEVSYIYIKKKSPFILSYETSVEKQDVTPS